MEPEATIDLRELEHERDQLLDQMEKVCAERDSLSRRIAALSLRIREYKVVGDVECDCLQIGLIHGPGCANRSA